MTTRSQWHIQSPYEPSFGELLSDIHPIVLQCLWNRGIRTSKEVHDFISSEYEANHDPFLFRHMRRAVECIQNAIIHNEKIGIYGDYDADGVNATAILYKVLSLVGAKNIELYIPHREKEGYGLNSQAIVHLHDQGVKVLITCDCGITAVKEVAEANEFGMKVIITDHHSASDAVPDAYAILHPGIAGEQYPFSQLAGGGVAFKLAQALLRSSTLESDEQIRQEKWLLDHVALSTVADMVPLIGENRVLTKYGLLVLAKTKTPGLRYIYELAQVESSMITTHTIGFRIAPRINAAGRMDHSYTALKTLITSDDNEARHGAEALERNNMARKDVTADIFDAADEQIRKTQSDRLWVHAYNPSWNLGVVGLVAGKIAQQYQRPTFIMGIQDDLIVGSGRNTIDRIDIMDVLHAQKHLLTRYGGHKMACGFSLKKEYYNEFIEGCNTWFEKNISLEDIVPTIIIDAELKLSEISWDLEKKLKLLQPFGMGNPEPVFVSYGLRVEYLKPLGSNGTHASFVVRDSADMTRAVVGFDIGSDMITALQKAESIDIVYGLEVNEWNGDKTLRMRMIDCKLY